MRRTRNPRPQSRKTLAVVFIIVIAAIGSLAVLADQWRHSDAGVVISVRGTRVVRPDAVRSAAAVSDTCVLAEVDLMSVQHRIEKLPFVRAVVVRREPPRTLVIDIIERDPLALVLGDGPHECMIDADGMVLPAMRSLIEYDVPVITGANMARVVPGRRVSDNRILNAVAVLRIADSLGDGYPTLFSEINVAHDRDLVMYTHEAGVPVIFGSIDRAVQKLISLRSFWESVAMRRDLREIEYLDVRFRDQVILRQRSASDSVIVAPQDSIIITSD